MKTFLFLSVMSLFCLTVSAQDWVQLGNVIPGEAAGDYCGVYSSISADGNTTAVGAQNNDGGGSNAGHVRVFAYNGTTWLQKGGDIDGEGDGFLSGPVGLSADGNTVAVGQSSFASQSGNVRVFNFQGGDWVLRGASILGAAGERAGCSVGISADGNRLAIGGRGYDSSRGRVRIFNWDGGSWVQLGSDILGRAVMDRFGDPVRISADGTTIITGAHFAAPVGERSGEISIHKFNGDEWILKGNVIEGEHSWSDLGESVDISADGNTVISGEQGFKDNAGKSVGRAIIFSWNGTAWVIKGSHIEGLLDGDRTGVVVAINNSGNIAATKGIKTPTGNNKNGNTRMFQFNGTGWVQLGDTFLGEPGGDLGYGLDFNGTGDTINIGNPFADSNGQTSGELGVYRYNGSLEITKNAFTRISMYPNPSNGAFTINLGKEYTDVSVQIFNILGQTISSEKYASAKTIEQEIKASAGIYFLNVSSKGGITETLKIIKN